MGLILTYSKSINSDQMAKLALFHYMQNWEREGDNISWIDDDKDAAQQKYDEAVANGAFNN